jgi:hypothetical protein
LIPKSASTISFGKAEHPRQGFPTQQNFLKRRTLCCQFLFSLEKDNSLARLQMEPNMDVTTQYKSGMLEFDLTQSLLGRYVGMEPSRVSRGLTEELPFDLSESKSIEETIAAMRLVQSEMSLPINWTQIGRCKPRIDQRRKELHETADPFVRRCILIRVSYAGFFQTIRSGQVITTPSEMTAAAFESADLASEAVRLLKKIGTESRIESFGAFRRASTMTRSLVKVGFEPATIGGADETN